MHSTLTYSIFLLSIFAYSSAALICQQRFQNSLEFSFGEEPAVFPTAVADLKPFVQTPAFPTTSRLGSQDSEAPAPTSQPSSTVTIHRIDDANTNFANHEQVNPRNLREGGFNIATWSPTAFAILPNLTPFKTPTSLPSITANPTFSEEFMMPTTTFATTVVYSTIYYTVRDIARGDSSTAIVPLSRALPRAFRTLAASSVLASGI